MNGPILARNVFRDETRQLIVLQLERLPDEMVALPLGKWKSSPGQPLYSVYQSEVDQPSAAKWSYSSGQIRQIIMPPHY